MRSWVFCVGRNKEVSMAAKVLCSEKLKGTSAHEKRKEGPEEVGGPERQSQDRVVVVRMLRDEEALRGRSSEQRS